MKEGRHTYSIEDRGLADDVNALAIVERNSIDHCAMFRSYSTVSGNRADLNWN